MRQAFNSLQSGKGVHGAPYKSLPAYLFFRSTPTAVALGTQVREGTKKAHAMADNTGFVSCF
ncbi:MAG: hypothetical protein O2787_05910, partial [Cyanobacteria bacterium]|nr:hypothetical protein [Cyanobacteriota bacterium]